MKKIIATILSFVAVLTLFIGSQANVVQASEVISAVELQQESKFVTPVIFYGNNQPPYQYYYNDGYFQGYIFRVSTEYVSGEGYYGLYAGTVYRDAPIEQLLPEK